MPAMRELPKVWRDLLQSILEATEHIHIPCDFQQGVCVASRAKKNGWGRCCCDACGSCTGYLEDGFAHPYHLTSAKHRQLQDACDPVKGFRTPQGCALPRKHRSPTCVFYVCGYLTDRHRDITDRLWAFRAAYSEASSSAVHGRWL